MARRPNGPPPAQPPAAPGRAAIYLRVSTLDQAREGYGLDAQRARCLAMAAAKGWPVVAEYADEGVSGTKGETHRPGLRRLLDDARAGQFDAVIVLDLSRLGRRTRLILDLVEQLDRLGVALVSCKEALDTSTAVGRFVVTLFAALAQLERDQTAERTAAALAAKAARDGDAGGRTPYGYTRTDDGLVEIDPERAGWVRRLVELRAAGNSMRAIARSLDQAGAPTPQGGQHWHASTVKSILDNADVYRGQARGSSTVAWPAILADDPPA